MSLLINVSKLSGERINDDCDALNGSLAKFYDMCIPNVAKWLPGGRPTMKEPSLPIHHEHLQQPLTMQLKSSFDSAPHPSSPQQTAPSEKTIYYLAYGSNLCKETFLGKRGIKPLSATNVVVPSLRLTFDLPGIPYTEPCFANTARRQVDREVPQPTVETCRNDEKTPLIRSDHSASRDMGYHKDRWHKGLVGVVYGLTPKDYAHVIATEGGGASYQDITVPCHILGSGVETVPAHPTTSTLLAHTLFAPTETGKPEEGGRDRRADPSYAQASARYLKLLTDGAAEHNLPKEYADYLAQIRPYRITNARQRVGQFIFMTVWFPIVMGMFKLLKMFADNKGRVPPWAAKLSAAVFAAVWKSYDGFFLGIFGDGERSIPDGGKASEAARAVLIQSTTPSYGIAKGDGDENEKMRR